MDTLSIYDLKVADEATLLCRAAKSVEGYPILQNIYDGSFLEELVRDKFHYDNYLLWLLGSHEPIAIELLRKIASDLTILGKAGKEKFRDKLRYKEKSYFDSYLTELEFAAYYRRRGYEVILEPPIPGTRKGPDFKIEKNGLEVYFEAKELFEEDLRKEESLLTQIHGRLKRVDEPFAFGLTLKEGLTQTHLKPLEAFVKRKLKEIEKRDVALPASFVFSDRGKALAEIDIIKRIDKLDHGFLSGMMPEIRIRESWKDIRRKISSKVKQLPSGYPGVIIAQSGHLSLNQDDITYAIWGDPIVVINLNNGSATETFGKDRIFKPKQNTRVSAIYYYRRRITHTNKFAYDRAVYHNPFSKFPLPPSFFKEKGVRQLVPVEKKKDHVTLRWIDL